MTPAVHLEILSDRIRRDVLRIRRDDVSEDVVDSIPHILELTQYGLDHGYIGHTYAIYADDVCVGIILMGEGVPWDCDPPELRGVPFYRIMGFIIDARYRGCGVGSQALEQTISAVFAEYGVRPIALAVQEDNLRAMRFYEAHGFCPNPARDEDDCYYLRYPAAP